MTDTILPAAAAAPSPPRRDAGGITRLGWILHHIVLIWLVALVIIFAMLNPFFITIVNLQNIMVQATVLGMLGLAIALPLMVAEIDLSIPANAGFSAAIGVMAF